MLIIITIKGRFFINSIGFTPQDIVLRDDALHKTGIFGHVETWYYDAIFDNNYSMVKLVSLFHINNVGFVLTGLFIYKDTILVKGLRRKFPYKCFSGSEEEPLIKINNQQIIKGHIDRSTKRWIYHISKADDKLGIDLEFIKTTKAWKGKTFLGNWLVIPRFTVNGTIFLDGNVINVSGEGYHDHNIYPIYAPFINKGYHFGKIPVDSMIVIWARVMKNRDTEELIVVLNKDQDYILIDPRDVHFTVEAQIKNHGKLMPTTCRLNVQNYLMNADIKIEPVNFHHIGVLAANYWRYHVRNIGKIQVDSVTKKIDTIEITEYLKFF